MTNDAATTAATETADTDAQARQQSSQGASGFPANTAVADMTAEQQAAYWKHHARKHETAAKDWSSLAAGRTAEQLQADLAELATLRQASLTDTERAVADARTQAQAETRARYAPMLAAAEFRAALAHVPDDRRDAIIEGLNLAAYVGEDGNVDTARVRAYAQTVAPPATGNPAQPRHDFGGGRRETANSGPSGVAAGRARFEAKRGNKQTTT
jgi:hypothetical protein